MLFEGIVDSVLRRHRMDQITEEQGRVILRRLHELLHDTEQGHTFSSENPENDGWAGKAPNTGQNPCH